MYLVRFAFCWFIFVQIVWGECSQRGIDLLIENDSALTLGGGTDRFYSNGFEGSLYCNQNVTNNSVTNIASHTLHALKSDQNLISVVKGVRLGHKIYTNSDIGLEDFEIDISRDRPYAAWLYANVFFEAETLDDAYFRHEFSIGCVGPCAQGEEVQREWHEVFGFKRPRGWDQQIENQLALQYFLEYKPARYEIFPFISLHPRIKASIGTIFNDLSFGGEFILGDESNRDEHIHEFKSDRWKWQLFFHNDVKFVAFNATLEGALFNDDSPHTVESSRFVLENGIGLRLDYNQYSFQYRFVGRSTEIEKQDWKFWDHKYGSFEFGLMF